MFSFSAHLHPSQHPFCIQTSAALRLQNDLQHKKGASYLGVDVGILKRAALPHQRRNNCIIKECERNEEMYGMWDESLLRQLSHSRSKARLEKLCKASFRSLFLELWPHDIEEWGGLTCPEDLPERWAENASFPKAHTQDTPKQIFWHGNSGKTHSTAGR